MLWFKTKSMIKQRLFFLLYIIPISLFAQDDIKTSGFFYKVSLASTLTINEDYTLFNEDDEAFINPSAYFLNNTLGYQFDERASIGLNVEYDWHSQQDLHFFPLHLSFRYNIFVHDDNLFLRAGYGRLLNMGKAFEKGTMYKVGIGYQIFDSDIDDSFLFGFDFSRKRFGFRQTEKLSSVSLFVEYVLF